MTKIQQDEITTISITKKTRDELKKQGAKGDSYDDIIKRLLNPKGNQNEIQP